MDHFDSCQSGTDQPQDLKLDLDHLRQQLGKPIRIAWANRSYFHPTDLYKGDEYNLLVLCSASKRVHGAEISEGGYIQGAGDDSESWAYGLTPPVFWANKSTIFQTAEEDLPQLFEELVKEQSQQESVHQATLITPTQNLYIGPSDGRTNERDLYDLAIDCNAPADASEGNAKRLNLGCGSAKSGGRDLRNHLDKVQAFISSQLAPDPSRSLLVTCESGKDLSAGVLLTILCSFYDDTGMSHLSSPSSFPQTYCLTVSGAFASSGQPRISKQFIRQRLAWIVSSIHDVNPSRTTLQSVNAFLMQRPDY